MLLIDSFNESCKNIAASYLKVGGDSMNVIRFRATAKGNLYHVYYIFRKLEPLGTEFNTVTNYVTGDLIFIEAHILKEWMAYIKYQH